MPPIHCGAMNHLNAVVDDFDRTVGHLGDVYGAQFLVDMPKEEWHACLVAIGGVIFELFSPHDQLLHARVGPHYIGVEYQVPDVDEARRAVLGRGMRVVRELGSAFHVHAADAFGVALEFYDGDFHAVPAPVPYLEPLHPDEHWREQPLGITGLDRYRVTVSDLDAAVRFFTEFVDGTVIYEQDRPSAGARAVGLALGVTTVELLSPTGAGPLDRSLGRLGDGISSVIFATADVERARSHLGSRGIRLEPGSVEGGFAVAPEDNAGLLFEFAPAGDA